MSKIDDYLAQHAEANRDTLNEIRNYIHSLVPDLEETISYGIPTLKYKDKNLIHFGSFDNHMSIFPGSHAIEFLGDELKDFKVSKGTVQFAHTAPLPKQLIKKMVSIRRADIDARS
ncbi:DUF1801 domain-containing protein [bacterium]|nr:DUF1801 domain-containing protein [bacterium]